jgi:hypothetical protein
LQAFIWQSSYLRLQRGGKQKAWRKKRKYDSLLWFLFPLLFLPLQLLQDYRNSNLEASGIAMTCSLHQAIPSSLQVTVPVGDIWGERTVFRVRGSEPKHGVK